MELPFILTVCLAATTFAYTERASVVSRRDAASGAANVYQLVRDTLDKARQGMQAIDLGEDAANVQVAADAYIDANGGEVPAPEIQAVIDEIAAKFNGAAAVSGLFDDPVIYQASLLDAAFNLWKGLVDKAEELEAAGQSPTPAIAAISLTAKSIQSIVVNLVSFVTYAEEAGAANVDDGEDDSEVKNPSKRWKVAGGVNYGNGGWSGGVSVSHSWRRRRLTNSEQKKRSEDPQTKKRSEEAGSADVDDREDDSELKNPSKRWQIGGGVNYGQGGWSGGVSVSHSWRRRRLVPFADEKRSDDSLAKRVSEEAGAADVDDREDDSELKNPFKRWQIGGSVNYGNGGWSGGVSVSHSWRRRRLVPFADEKRSDDSLAKRVPEVSVKVKWGNN